MAKMTVKDLDLKDKTVLMRADFNVPLDASLAITDDTRIRETVPTIKFILEKGAKKVVICLSPSGTVFQGSHEEVTQKQKANRAA